MTPLRPLYVQEANIIDPTTIPQCAIIDMLTGVDRTHHRTLIVHAALRQGATLSSPVAMYLWREGLWDDEDAACANIGSSSSIDPDVGMDIALADIGPRQRWGLIDVTTRTHSGGSETSLAFVYPWMPAGRYLAAIGTGTIGGTGGIVIAAQYTE